MTIKLRRLQACLVGWQSPLQNNFTQHIWYCQIARLSYNSNTMVITIRLYSCTAVPVYCRTVSFWTRPQWTGPYHPKIAIKLKLSAVLNSAEPRALFWGLGQWSTLYIIHYSGVYYPVNSPSVFGDCEHSVYHMYSGVYYTVYNPPLLAEDDNQPKPVCSLGNSASDMSTTADLGCSPSKWTEPNNIQLVKAGLMLHIILNIKLYIIRYTAYYTEPNNVQA